MPVAYDDARRVFTKKATGIHQTITVKAGREHSDSSDRIMSVEEEGKKSDYLSGGH